MIKISITGPESTGKSWLSENLAYVFNTIWVKESMMRANYLISIQIETIAK